MVCLASKCEAEYAYESVYNCVCFPQAWTYLTLWQSFFEAIVMVPIFLQMGYFITSNEHERIQFYASLKLPGTRRSSAKVDGLKWTYDFPTGKKQGAVS
jgi:hypothetical protein